MLSMIGVHMFAASSTGGQDVPGLLFVVELSKVNRQTLLFPLDAWIILYIAVIFRRKRG